MITFDEKLILKELNDISEFHRIAFAASCCERMLPSYKKFVEVENWGDYECFRIFLNQIWGHIIGNYLTGEYIINSMDMCFEIGPDSEYFESVYTSYAIDLGSAIYHTFKYCLTSDIKNLLAVANAAISTVDLFVQEKYNMDPNDHNLEFKICNDELMQTEIIKQIDDLKLLANNANLDEQFVELFRSKVEGKSNIEL
jgi:uncharacterized protein